MNRALTFTLVFAAAMVSVLCWFWVNTPPSNQELLADTVKAIDYAEGWKSVGGPPWWTPNFLQGHSLALSLSSGLTSVWLLLWKSWAGLLAGPKIAALLCLFIGSLGTYALAQRLLKNPTTAAVCALAFLLSPSICFRLAHVEHVVFATSFAVIPFVFISLIILLENPTRLSGIFFGLSFSALLITYAKAAALLAPFLFVFAIIFWIWKHNTWRPPASALLAAILTIVILGVLPNLPAMREMRLATVFELAPFEGWQNAFSLKSNLLWFDRVGILSAGADPGFAPTSSRGANYLGLVPALFIAALLIIRPASLYATNTGFLFRLFILLALAAHWLSFGPRSVLGGQFAFLGMAGGVADPVVALSWFLLVVQGWVILRLLPPRIPGRTILGVAFMGIYFLIPGFRLVSWFPVFSDLRAPHDFSQIGGTFFLIIATGCAVQLIVEMLPVRVPRSLILLVAGLLAALDVSPYFHPFFQSPLDAKTFSDFEEANVFLADAPRAGWIQPISGRYFYLLTPHLSNRGLNSEAFHSHKMQRGMRYLQNVAQTNPSLMKAYWNLGGIAYVLIDKKDPDSPAEAQDRFKSFLPSVFENEHFLILENTTSLAPAFLAQGFASGDADFARTALSGLELEPLGAIVLPSAPETNPTQPEKIGELTEDGLVMEQKSTGSTKNDFLPLTLASPRLKDYHKISLAPSLIKGWAVVPEAYHPDWQAFSGEKRLSVLPSAAALLAVQILDPSRPLTLQFIPPWWYNGFLAISAFGWLFAGALLLAPALPFAPSSLKKWLSEFQGFDRGPSVRTEFSRTPILRAVVVIPTYNESTSLPRTLEKVFASHDKIEVLVVDDASPDGTGEWVKNHPDFGKRLHLLARAGKLGLGSAYKEGFHWAFERNFDACLEMDADLSHDPADIPRLLQALDEGADAAIGSRYLGGVRVMNWAEGRLFLSTGASRFVRLVTGLPLTDATSGFKALRVSVLRTLNWKQFRAGGYGFQVELHHALWQAGARLVEVPIVFTERRDGETKMTIGIAVEAAWRTIRLGLEKK